ncbi:MAG: D-3-phosphoglycerate dehydrogenase / 2-oxoglutarate reductase [Actinomycetota bacterium]
MTDTPRLLITCRQMQVSMPLVEQRLKEAGVEWDCPPIPGQQFSAAQLTPIIGSYDGMIAGDDEITAEVLRAGLPRLKTVAKWGIGVDGIDLGSAAELGIDVTNTPGMFDDEVADVAFGYVLSLFRGLHQIDRAVRAGNWTKLEGHTPRDHTLGIVGLGGTGRALAVRAHAVGMNVIGSEPFEANAKRAADIGVRVVSVEEVFDEADVVSLHCPLTPETHGLVSAAMLARMKPGSYLVNTSRGKVVHETAVIDALASGHLAGAALDVFEVEPLPAESPLRGFDNVILGAHNGSNTAEAVARTSRQAVANALRSLGIG